MEPGEYLKSIALKDWGMIEEVVYDPFQYGLKFCKKCNYRLSKLLKICPLCDNIQKGELLPKSNFRFHSPSGVEINLDSLIAQAGKDLKAYRKDLEDLPPITGSIDVIALKKCMERAVKSLEGMMGEIFLDGDSEKAHGSIRIQFRIQRTDVEVWDKK